MGSRTSIRTDFPATEIVDNRIIAAMRLVLAASALAIILIDPSQPDRFIPISYAALGLYTIYSAILFVFAQRRGLLPAPLMRWGHWLDMGWYLVFITLSQGTSSIFFFFFFFAILVAAFQYGFRAGLSVTIASALLFTIFGRATAPEGAGFELNRFLLRPIYLIALGYLISYWGGFEIALKRRLTLLKEMTALSNPRFGVDRTTGIVLEQVRIFYNADLCLSVTIDPDTGAYRMRRADRDNPEGAAHVDSIPAELGRLLLAPPTEHTMVYRGLPQRSWDRKYYGYDLQTGARSDEGYTACEGVARTLDAKSFLSIPLYHNRNPFGRLYVTASRRYAFHNSDVGFLLQVSAHITPILDSIRLVDKLASEAAEEERQRIARDLHDSVIQPYIGLQIGLGALRQKLALGADVTGEVERLIALTTEGIGELRGYVRGLKSSGEAEGDLLPSLRRFAARFAAATGIEVQIQAQDVVRVNDRLAAEVFQMVAEGLSNVRRHTQAPRATVNLSRRADHLVVRIEDEGTPESLPALFTPRSITERAAALGGQAHVEHRADNGARVVVEIPL